MHVSEFTVGTSAREVVNLTGKVQDIVAASGVREGFCIVEVRHTTAGIYTNVTEDLQEDVLSVLHELIPHKDYNHNRYDPNAEAHIKKILTGRAEIFTISNGSLQLGTWEKIQLIEFDGPRKRTVHVTVIAA